MDRTPPPGAHPAAKTQVTTNSKSPTALPASRSQSVSTVTGQEALAVLATRNARDSKSGPDRKTDPAKKRSADLAASSKDYRDFRKQHREGFKQLLVSAANALKESAPNGQSVRLEELTKLKQTLAAIHRDFFDSAAPSSVPIQETTRKKFSEALHELTDFTRGPRVPEFTGQLRAEELQSTGIAAIQDLYSYVTNELEEATILARFGALDSEPKIHVELRKILLDPRAKIKLQNLRAVCNTARDVENLDFLIEVRKAADLRGRDLIAAYDTIRNRFIKVDSDAMLNIADTVRVTVMKALDQLMLAAQSTTGPLTERQELALNEATRQLATVEDIVFKLLSSGSFHRLRSESRT